MRPIPRPPGTPVHLAFLFAGLAFLLRTVYLLESADNPFRHHLHLDPAFYDQWARSILGGQIFGPGPFLQAPLYPYFLAGAYAILGANGAGPLWIQALLGAATVFCATLVARRAWGRGGAIAAGLLLALYQPAIFYTGVLLVPVLATFLLALALVFTPSRPLLAGLCTGAAGLAHPLLLPGGLVAVLGGVWSGGSLRARWRPILFVLLGTTLAVAPATVHNLILSRSFLPIAANSGVNLYIGNGPAANGYFTPPPGLGRDEDLHGLREASRLAGRPLNAVEASRFWTARTQTGIAAHPGRVLTLFLRKVYLFFHAYEAPQVESLDFEKRYSTLLRIPLLPGWALLVALTAVAVCLRHRDRLVRTMVAATGVTALATAAFFVTGRFRFPTHLYLALAAAGGLVELGRVPRIERARWWRAMAVALVTVLIFVPNWPGIGRARTFGNTHYQLGVIAEKDGQVGDAEREYADALRYDPKHARAAINLGILTARGGDVPRAEPLLEQGVTLDPRSARGFLALGQIHQLRGDLAGACSLYARAWAADTSFVKGLESLAIAGYLSGDVARAERLARELVRRTGARDPLAARCSFLLSRMNERRRFGWPLWTSPARAEGDLALAVRDLVGAETAYSRAVQTDPRDLVAQLELARVAAARGDGATQAERISRFLSAGGSAEAAGLLR